MNENSLPITWVSALTFLLGNDRTLVEEFIDNQKLEPDPFWRTLKGLFLAVAFPYLLLLLLILLNLIAGIWSLLGLFILSLISTFIPFYVISGLTYIFAKLLGGQENYTVHSYLLSLIYAPLTLVSLLIPFLLTLLSGQISLSCLNILGVGILILIFVGTVKILRYGQELSLVRSIIATGLTTVISFTIAACVGVSLVMTGMVDPASLPANATATRTAEKQATATGIAERQATIEARPIAGRFIIKGRENLKNVSFSPDGDEFVMVGQEIIIWDTTTLKEITTLSHPGNTANYSPDGLKLITIDHPGNIRIWDTQTWQEITTLHSSILQYTSTEVDFSPDGQKLVLANTDNLLVLDINTGELVYSTEEDPIVISPTYSPDGNYIAAALREDIKIWDADTAQEVKFFDQSIDNLQIVDVMYSPDGHHLAAARMQGTVEIWDTNSWERILFFAAHAGSLSHATYSPDGRNIITTNRLDGTAKIWDVTTGKEKEIATLHLEEVKFADYSPDGKKIITISDTAVVIWDMQIIAGGGNFAAK